MTTFATTHSHNNKNVVAALACLAFGCDLSVARRQVQWLCDRDGFWGACRRGDDIHTFSVDGDWDGYRFHGYFVPNLSEVANDTGISFWS